MPKLQLTFVMATLLLVNSASADGLPAPGSTYHILFATSGRYRTTTSTSLPPPALAFKGIDGADYQMSSAAFNAALPDAEDWTGASPSFRAILSISGSNARDRLSVSGPVINMHGTQLATSTADLFDGSLAAPVAYDEFGNLITTNTDVWSDCTPVGTAGGQSCGTWNNVSGGVTGRIGAATDAGTSWLGAGPTKACNSSARLYALSNALTAPLWGDYDGSGAVDGRDFLEWQRYYGAGGPESGIPIPAAFHAARSFLDGNRTHVVGLADLEVWAEHYGQPLPVMTSSVPEPSTIMLALLGACGVLARRR